MDSRPSPSDTLTRSFAWLLGLTLAACTVTSRPLRAGSDAASLPHVDTAFTTPRDVFTGSQAATSPSIAGVCPSPEMSCYPGCAMVGDTMACGSTLVLLAGTLAASLIYLAAEEAISLPDFCGKYGTLCMKARPRAQPRRFTDNTPCIFLGAGGSSMWGKGLTCKYNCRGEILEMQLDPPENRCPGDDAAENLIEWLKIKWLEIKRIL